MKNTHIKYIHHLTPLILRYVWINNVKYILIINIPKYTLNYFKIFLINIRYLIMLNLNFLKNLTAYNTFLYSNLFTSL